MRYRRFGKTGLRMPVFTCGGMRYQHAWKDLPEREVPKKGQANVEAIIHRAIELGICHIETARGYGTSEMQLGAILPALPRKQLLVQTKVGPQKTRRQFLRSFETSLKYLKLDYVDLLSLHGINDRQKLDWSLKKGGCLEAALGLREQGLVRHVGFSTHAPCEVILETLASDGFEYINLHYYFVNPLTRPAVIEAARRDLGVFIISPNDKGGMLYDPPTKFSNLCHPLSPMQFNDLFCLSHPEVHTLSIGASRPSDFDEHLASLEYYEQLESTIAPIRQRIDRELEHALGASWCASWSQGIPDYLELPGQVNVREIVRLWTFAKGLDLMAWARARYNLLGRGDSWFPGESAEKLEREALLAALAQSPNRDRVFEVLADAHQLFAGEARKRLSQS